MVETPHHRIVVLGGTGFVGRHLLARLAADGHTLVVPTRHRERHRDLLVLPTLSLLAVDITEPKVLEQTFADADVVVNLIGILNEPGHRRHQFDPIHVELPRRIVAACRQRHVPRLLHMSALGADAGRGSSRYQRTKGEGENIVHTAVGINATSFRPSVIFGPGDSFFNRFTRLLRRTPLLFPLARPEARFAPVYVGDVVEAFVRAIDRPQSYGHRYELCGPRTYTLRELVEYTAHTLGLRRYVIGLPDWAGWLQATLLEQLPGKPFSRDNFRSMQRDNVCKGAFPALFGIEPTPLESVVPYYLRPKRPHERINNRHHGGL